MITKEAADSHIRCLLRNKIGENMYEYTYNGYNIRAFYENGEVRFKITNSEGVVIKNFVVSTEAELANQLMKMTMYFTHS
jgi:hypothetical protein